MENYPKEYFNLVNTADKKIFDKELKTKQLTYFQDAMLRFGKNKYNVIASIILVIMMMLSAIVPMLTPEELYTDTNGDLTLLPPRVPLLEDIGLLDGTNFYKNVTVNPATVSDTTGLGYPYREDFDPEHIDFATLENETQIGELVDPSFRGGTNNFTVADGFYSVAVYSPNLISMGNGENLHIDVESINAGTIEVYMIKSNATYEQTIIDPVTQEEATVILIEDEVSGVPLSWDASTSVVYVGSVDQAGVSTVEFNQSLYGVLVLRYVLEEPAAGSETASLNSIHTTYGEPDETVVKEFEGYTLAVFKQISLDSELENGNYKRKNAERLVANFVYDKYAALFSPKHAFRQGTEYDQILADNPGMFESIKYNSTNPFAWTFGEGYPITEVINYVVSLQDTDSDGIMEEYYTYELMLDGKYKLGYEEVPYFYFGTDVGGRDLFSLIWLGLRTSLLLGFLAAATNIFFGIIWGSVSGYYGGQVDILMERFTDIWGSFPQITMISIISVIIGPGFLALYIFMVYDGWIGAAKITRMQFYRYKGREYVLAARTLGASDRRIIFKHILPNALGTIVTRVVLSIPSVIFLEVNLSYLGFGIGSGQSLNIGPISLTGTSIGVILAEGQTQILAGNLWLIIYPTIIVSILMITFNMFGNALRDALNPQLRGNS